MVLLIKCRRENILGANANTIAWGVRVQKFPERPARVPLVVHAARSQKIVTPVAEAARCLLDIDKCGENPFLIQIPPNLFKNGFGPPAVTVFLHGRLRNRFTDALEFGG